MQDRILKWPEVQERTGLSRTTVWRLTAAGRFPAAVALTNQRVGWRESELAKWIETRTARKAA